MGTTIIIIIVLHTEYGPRHICIVKSRLLLFTESHLLSHHENINLLLTLQQSLNSVPGFSCHPNVAYLTAPSFRVRTGIQFIILAAVTQFLPLFSRCAFCMKVGDSSASRFLTSSEE